MHQKMSIYDQLCEVPTLMNAYKLVRSNKGAAGIDLTTLAAFERDLMSNLDDLAARLREGRYWPMPLRRFEMQKANGKTRTLGIFTVEDRIVQRAALDLLEPLWEPSFLECSYGFRPNRNVEMAVKRVLEYRAAGDVYIVDADIADCFGALDHGVIMNLVRQRVRDKRMLSLIQMWLDAGQVFQAAESETSASAPLAERLADYATHSVGEAISHLMDEHSYGGGYGAYSNYPGEVGLENVPQGDPAAEMRKAARREAFKRLGRDAVLLGLTYFGRARRLLSPATLAITGAAVLATAAYPAASRLIRGRWGNRSGSAGAVQGSALSPLLCNIVLHEFDVAVTKAGFRLVRYADDFVITCRDEQEARQALDFAGRKLAELRLQIHPEKTRILRFEQGLEFLGYKFDPFQMTATPAPTSTQQPIKVLLREAPAALNEWRAKATPVVAQFGKQAVKQVKTGAARVVALLKRREKTSKR